jgi:hypothetical protein
MRASLQYQLFRGLTPEDHLSPGLKARWPTWQGLLCLKKKKKKNLSRSPITVAKNKVDELCWISEQSGKFFPMLPRVRHQWLMPIILVTQQEESRRIMV